MNESRVREGERLFAEGRADEARTCFLAVIEDEPSNVMALNNLGVIAQSTGGLEAAEQLFRRALAVNNDHLPSLTNLAFLYSGAKVWDKALQCLLRRVELAPDNVDFQNETARTYLEVGDQYRAGQFIRRSLELAPDQPELREILVAIDSFLSSYSVVQTEVGPFLISNQDMVLRRELSAGVPFGKAEIDQAIQMLGVLAGASWTPRSFIDVGANIGTHTIYAFAAHGFEQGIAVEIAPDNFRMLRCNLILAKIDEQVQALNCGLSSQTGSSTIERSPSNLADHRVRLGEPHGADVHGERSWETEPCDLRTFDEIVPAEFLGADGSLVWIDTQGHEPHILRGASSLFASHTPFVIEFWPYGMERQGSRAEDIIDLLSPCSVHDLRGGAGELDSDALASLYQHHLAGEMRGRSPHTDLLVIP